MEDHGEDGNACKILVGKAEVNVPLRRPTRSLDGGILQETGRYGLL